MMYFIFKLFPYIFIDTKLGIFTIKKSEVYTFLKTLQT